MATYNKNTATHQTLTANTVDTVNLNASNFGQVEVYNAATDSTDLWVRNDGTNPTVGGDDCIRVPAGSAVTLDAPAATTEVRLISSGAIGYSVTGI